MKKEKIEKYLNKEVTITYIDNFVAKGILHKEEDFPNDPNKLRDGGYLLRPCNFTPAFHFRKSHVKKIELLNGGDVK